MSWKDFWKGVAGNAAKKGTQTAADRITQGMRDFSREVDRKIHRTMRKLFALSMQIVFAAVGAVFVLASVVLFLARYFTLEGGLLIVGLLSVLVAMFFALRR